MEPWAVYNSYRCYDQKCQLYYDNERDVYVCPKHKANHVCGWSDCAVMPCNHHNSSNKIECYKGPKCPVVENEEGWLVCEMTGSVLDSQPISINHHHHQYLRARP